MFHQRSTGPATMDTAPIAKKEPDSEPFTPEKVPRAVQRARDALRGLDVTAENLKKVLGKKEFNTLANNMRNNMGETVKQEYKKLTTDDERRKVLAFYVLDPKTCTLTGWNSQVVFNKSKSISDWRWLHQSEIASPLYLNSEHLAEQLCKSGELEDRPSEYACFAAKGLKQYHFHTGMMRKENGNKTEAGTSAKTDLAQAEYEKVSNSMMTDSAAGISALKRKKPSAPKPAESESSKMLKAAKATKAQSTKRLKTLIDKVSNKVKVNEDEDLVKIKAKYPQAMVDFLSENLTKRVRRCCLRQPSTWKR